jgi:nucleoside-diphosphate-sugar epimerase
VTSPRTLAVDQERVVIVGGGDHLERLVRQALPTGVAADVSSGGSGADLERRIDGATGVVLLGASGTGGTIALDGTGRTVDVDEVRRVLDAASSAGVAHLVVLSTAMVYGAWGNNPIPLTEAAPVRPNPGVIYATETAEIERLVGEWRDTNRSATATVLRPVVTVQPDDDGWLERSPWLPSGWGPGSSDVGPPMQYLLLDDLASAVALSVTARLDGPFNVAPEGWIPPEVRLELIGPKPRLRLPEAVADLLTARRLRRSGYPAEVAAYARESWVVASDALRGAGWAPNDSNEEAFVAADTPGPLTSMDPRRRQTISLAAAGLAVVGAVTGVVLLVRRIRRLTADGGFAQA